MTRIDHSRFIRVIRLIRGPPFPHLETMPPRGIPFTVCLFTFVEFTALAMEKARKKIARFAKKSKIIRAADVMTRLTTTASRGGVEKW